MKTHRHRYSGQVKVQVGTPGPSRTKQSFKEECDINNIMRKFQTTGKLPDMIKSNPAYGDFSDVPDYQDALDLVQMAGLQFQNLSAKVRREFDNDPAQFLAFATDPNNGKKMVEMGLAVARPVESAPDAVPAPKKAGQKGSGGPAPKDKPDASGGGSPTEGRQPEQ